MSAIKNILLWFFRSFKEYFLLIFKMLRWVKLSYIPFYVPLLLILYINVMTIYQFMSFGGIVTVVVLDIGLLMIGYLIFVSFNYIPNTIVGRVTPIRNRINEIYRSEFYESNFASVNDIESFGDYFEVTKVPSVKILKIWIYKLEVQRNAYLMFAPFGYLLLTLFRMSFVATDTATATIIYNNIMGIIDKYRNMYELLKWLFIVTVVTDEMVTINNDISKLQLLVDLDISRDGTVAEEN